MLQILEATEGGTRRHLRDLSLGLARRGWRVDLAVACHREASFAQDLAELASQGVGVHLLPLRRGLAPLHDFLALARLHALIARLHPDVVHAHSSKAGLLARLAVRRPGPPLVYTPHCFAFDMCVAPPLRWFYRQIEHALVPRCDCLIAVCASDAAAARRIGFAPARIERIPNGVPPPDAPRPATPPRWDVGFVGRLDAQKDPLLLLRALPLLRQTHPGVRVAFMGTGRLAPRLRRLVRRQHDPDSVSLLPAGGRAQVASFLRDCALLALPSRWEGFPYVLLESLAAGTPVVATAVGGVPELLRAEQEGLLVPAGDPAALAAALARLLHDPALRQRLAAAAPARAAAFPLESMIDRVERCYQRASAQSSIPFTRSLLRIDGNSIRD